MATPVRNVRIADPMWEKLGKLADKRKTTNTALIVEGIEFILDAGGYSKPDPPSTEALQQELEALALRVKELEGQVEGQLVPPIDETLTQTVNALTQRLDQIESTLAPLIQALAQVPQVGHVDEVNALVVGSEGVDAEGTDVDELEFDASPLPPTLEYPLSQRQLSFRLDQPQSYYLKRQREKGKEHFEVWSQGLDPDGIAWTFEEPKRRRGKVGGKALKFYPKS